MEISVSELKLYLQCPRSYKLCEIDGVEPEHKSLSLCRGAAVKKIISKLHNGKKIFLDYTQEEIDVICEQKWQEEILDPTVNLDELNTITIQEKKATKKQKAIPAVTKGERILQNIKTWVFEYTREEVDFEVLYTNIYFQTIIGDVVFCGWIDQVRRHPELGLQILNFNTSSQAPHFAYLEHDFIMGLYLHAAWHGTLFPKYPDLTKKVRLETIPSLYVYYFPHLERYQRKNGSHKKGDRKGNSLIEVVRTEKTLLDFEYELLYIASGIKEEFFPMMPKSLAGCSICPYAVQCNRSYSIFADISFNVEEFQKEKEAIDES